MCDFVDVVAPLFLGGGIFSAKQLRCDRMFGGTAVTPIVRPVSLRSKTQGGRLDGGHTMAGGRLRPNSHGSGCGMPAPVKPASRNRNREVVEGD